MGKNHHHYNKKTVMDFLWLVSSEYKVSKIEIMYPIYTSHSAMGHRWGPHTGEGERTARAAAVTFHTSPLCSWGLLGEQRWRPPHPHPTTASGTLNRKLTAQTSRRKLGCYCLSFLPEAAKSSDTRTRSFYRKSAISCMALTPLLLRLPSTTEYLQFTEKTFLFFSCLFLCSHFLFSSCSIPPLNMKNELTFVEHWGQSLSLHYLVLKTTTENTYYHSS